MGKVPFVFVVEETVKDCEPPVEKVREEGETVRFGSGEVVMVPAPGRRGPAGPQAVLAVADRAEVEAPGDAAASARGRGDGDRAAARREAGVLIELGGAAVHRGRREDVGVLVDVRVVHVD